MSDRKRWIRRAAALAGGLALACGGEESKPTGASMGVTPAGETAAEAAAGASLPEFGVRLEPERPRPGQRLEAFVEPVGHVGSGVGFEYSWILDGRPAGNQSTLRVAGDVERGASIQVSVVAVSGGQRSAPVEATARIGNAPPELHQVALEPSGPVTAGHDVVAVPKATDADGDDIEFEYRWYVNEATAGPDGNVLPASTFQRGDQIRVAVRASDGQDWSSELRSVAIPVANASPKITSKPGSLDADGRFVYRVAVEDPDGDTGFSYRLAQAPAGMQIDAVDGTVRWEPSEDQAGEHTVQIEVRDSQGGTGTQTFAMSIAFEDAPPASR